MTVTGVLASIIGVTLAPIIAGKIGKRYAAITMFFGAVIALLLPIGLRIIGVMPANGTNLLFGILKACADRGDEIGGGKVEEFAARVRRETHGVTDDH